MEHTAVKSREIAIVGYDRNRSTLEIAFRSGGVYRYEGVGDHLHQELLNSSSIGSFFTQKIKDHYPYQRIH